MDWLEMRFAEVMLNLAETANETGRLVEAKNQVRTLRQRAGIAVGSFDYGLATVNIALYTLGLFRLAVSLGRTPNASGLSRKISPGCALGRVVPG